MGARGYGIILVTKVRERVGFDVYTPCAFTEVATCYGIPSDVGFGKETVHFGFTKHAVPSGADMWDLALTPKKAITSRKGMM